MFSWHVERSVCLCLLTNPQCLSARVLQHSSPASCAALCPSSNGQPCSVNELLYLSPQVSLLQTARTSPRTQAPSLPQESATHHAAALLPSPHALPSPSRMLQQVCCLPLDTTHCSQKCREILRNYCKGKLSISASEQPFPAYGSSDRNGVCSLA